MLLACALRTSLFFQSLPANRAPYRQNCVSPEEDDLRVPLTLTRNWWTQYNTFHENTNDKSG